MAGVTDSAFRGLCLEQGAALVYTEMDSPRALSYNDRKTAALLHVPEGGRPVSAQIFGHEPRSPWPRGAKRALDISGAEVIDINMGCPVGKVVKSGDGSALMRTPELAAEIVAAVAMAVPVPVTVKIRKGWDGGSVNAVELAKLLERPGPRAIGRARPDARADGTPEGPTGTSSARSNARFQCPSSRTGTCSPARTRRTF